MGRYYGWSVPARALQRTAREAERTPGVGPGHAPFPRMPRAPQTPPRHLRALWRRSSVESLRAARYPLTGSAMATRYAQSTGMVRRDNIQGDQLAWALPEPGTEDSVGAPCCMSGMLRIPGMSWMPPGCPDWGCIMAMFRQHGHMPLVDWPGCAGWVIWPGCWPGPSRAAHHRTGCCGRTRGLGCAWCIGQARTGVAAKPAATAMARVSFLMACPSGTDAARFALFAGSGNSQCGERQA